MPVLAWAVLATRDPGVVVSRSVVVTVGAQPLHCCNPWIVATLATATLASLLSAFRFGMFGGLRTEVTDPS